MNDTIMPIVGLDVWLAIVVRCLVEGKERGELRQKEYGNSYKRMIDCYRAASC